MDGWIILPPLLMPSYHSLFPPPWHCIWSPGSNVSWPSSNPRGLYNLAQQALISKSRLLSFTLLCSSHHWATSSTPKGGNNPYPRRTEHSTAGVHRPHMHLVIRAPLFIHHLGQYSGSVLALHHLLAFVCVPCVCLYFSGPYKACLPWASSCVCVCGLLTYRRCSFENYNYISRAYGLLIGRGCAHFACAYSVRNRVCHDWKPKENVSRLYEVWWDIQ